MMRGLIWGAGLWAGLLLAGPLLGQSVPAAQEASDWDAAEEAEMGGLGCTECFWSNTGNGWWPYCYTAIYQGIRTCSATLQECRRNRAADRRCQ